jgi:Flp pilus assembly protein TadD
MDAVLQRRNDPAARLAEWKGVVQAHPNEAVPKLYLGRALEVLGDTAGAETAYREALQLDPEQLEAKAMLGAVIAAGGGVEGGLRTLDEAVLAVPGLAGPAAEACERAAQTRLSGGDHAGALTLLRRARSLSPTDLRYRVSLGGALEAAGDDAAALEEYRAVVGEVPESPHSSARIDAIYGRRKDSSGRVAEWRRAVAAHPGAATPRLHLGLALEASGDEAGAESAYREALSRDAALEAESALFGRVKGAGRSAP